MTFDFSKVPKPYSLYYTLNKSINEKDLSVIQTNKLLEFLNDLNEENKKVILMLIVEFARVEVKYDIKKITENIFPFDGKQIKNNMKFDLEILPIKLKWILWKFKSIVDKEKN